MPLVLRPHRLIVSVVILMALRALSMEDAMATIGFIGLGNMGAPMAANLVKAQHHVTGFDVVAAATAAPAGKGAHPAPGIAETAASGDIVITMLPAGPQVRAVYLGPDGIIAHARPGAL